MQTYWFNFLIIDKNMKNALFGNVNLGLLLSRLGLSAIFIVSGYSKLMDIAGTTAFFAKIGLAPFFVYLVIAVELLGGIAMLLGIGVRIVGLLMAVNMFFAIYLVKFASGFGGYRLDLLLLLVALGIAFSGPGKYSICGGRCKIGSGENSND